MDSHKAEFIEFMVRCGVLRFGRFTTKSGRQTPYFIDTGRYQLGSQIAKLGTFYAQAIVRSGISYNLLFGPAYKGIPVAVATASALATVHNMDVGFCFNRKEPKDHGEGGHFVGHAPQQGDRVLILDDVTTSGASVRETAPLLLAPGGVTLAGLIVSVDRLERGSDDRTALRELSDTYHMPCTAIVTIDEIVEHLHGRRIDGEVVLTDALRKAVLDHQARYRGLV